jgi:NAD-reducing hydrogenase large subunit
MHYGQILQSHALHFFHLASPDLLFGFDAAPARRNVVERLGRPPRPGPPGHRPAQVRPGVIRITAGKRVHGTGAVPGGVNKPVTGEERDELRAALPEVLAWAEAGVTLVAASSTPPTRALRPVRHRALEPAVAGRRRRRARSVRRRLRARDADGALIFDGVAPADYGAHLRENVRSWSYMKFPFLAARGAETAGTRSARWRGCRTATDRHAAGRGRAPGAPGQRRRRAPSTRRWRSTGRA